MGDTLDPWVVLYKGEGQTAFEPPIAFTCRAYDGDDAEEQCLKALPGCEVMWTYLSSDISEAYRDYWKGMGD